MPTITAITARTGVARVEGFALRSGLGSAVPAAARPSVVLDVASR